MKYARMALLAASSAFFIGCAQMPAGEAITRPIGPDYMATGSVEDIRAYVYGNRTVLQFDKAPRVLAIRDENGKTVPFEKEGNYFLLERRVDVFTAWIDGSAVQVMKIFATQLRLTKELEGEPDPSQEVYESSKPQSE